MSPRLSLAWRARVARMVFVVPPLVHLRPIDRLTTRLATQPAQYDVPPMDALRYEVDRWLGFLPWPWRSTCLKRATILFVLLRRSGIPVMLQIGVRRAPDGALAAHAWLTRDGMLFLEPPSSDAASYQVITSLPEVPVTP